MSRSVEYLGIDPGSAWTGLAVRHGDQFLGGQVIHNDDPIPGHGVGDSYLNAVMREVYQLMAMVVRSHPATRWVVAIEGVIVPAGFADGKKRFVSPKDILGLGIVYGYLRGALPDARTVQPNHHGYGLLAGYPEQLVTPGERRAGLNREAPQNSKMRHIRSAWDVTISAERLTAQAVLR